MKPIDDARKTLIDRMEKYNRIHAVDHIILKILAKNGVDNFELSKEIAEAVKEHYSTTVMTDLEKFVDTYKQFGVEVITYENSDGNIAVTLNGYDETSTESDKFDGYNGFVSDLEFTKDGKFLRQGFWE